MRKTILGALLITVPAIQMASASEHHARRAHDHWDFRGSYNQLNHPSIDEMQERRNSENFGFSVGRFRWLVWRLIDRGSNRMTANLDAPQSPTRRPP
jgi:hypothetical protein